MLAAGPLHGRVHRAEPVQVLRRPPPGRVPRVPLGRPRRHVGPRDPAARNEDRSGTSRRAARGAQSRHAAQFRHAALAPREPLVKGDKVEIVIDTGGATKTYEVAATRAGRRVEVVNRRGLVEVTEVTRSGSAVRTARFMASRVVALVEHPADQRPRAGAAKGEPSRGVRGPKARARRRPGRRAPETGRWHAGGGVASTLAPPARGRHNRLHDRPGRPPPRHPRPGLVLAGSSCWSSPGRWCCSRSTRG